MVDHQTPDQAVVRDSGGLLAVEVGARLGDGVRADMLRFADPYRLGDAGSAALFRPRRGDRRGVVLHVSLTMD